MKAYLICKFVILSEDEIYLGMIIKSSLGKRNLRLKPRRSSVLTSIPFNSTTKRINSVLSQANYSFKRTTKIGKNPPMTSRTQNQSALWVMTIKINKPIQNSSRKRKDQEQMKSISPNSLIKRQSVQSKSKSTTTMKSQQRRKLLRKSIVLRTCRNLWNRSPLAVTSFSRNRWTQQTRNLRCSRTVEPKKSLTLLIIRLHRFPHCLVKRKEKRRRIRRLRVRKRKKKCKRNKIK